MDGKQENTQQTTQQVVDASSVKVENKDQVSAQSTVDTPTENAEGTEKEQEVETFPIFVQTCGENKQQISLQVTPMDNLQDIRQFLFESVDTCYITNYNLFLNGQKLNDYSDLADIADLKPNAVIEMREAPYDERTIRLHVRHMRDLINSASIQQSLSPSEYNHISKEAEKQEEGEFSFDAPQTLLSKLSLSDYVHHNENDSLNCLKSIVFSGWNPPSGNRKLQGDLIYLEVFTVENSKQAVFVTGSTRGFFVNQSTSTYFDPRPTDKFSHTIVGLLNQLSPTFKKNFQQILANNVQKHPFEVLGVPIPVIPWVSQEDKVKYDVNRAEDNILFGADNDFRGQLRDWNEEYQTFKELPRETIKERILRDRALFKFNCDFVEAAMKGAIAIVEKTVPPINPLDPEKAFMYIYNNIFFSYALDGRDIFKDIGGDRAAYVSINNDLKGIRAFNRVDIKGLHTLATAVVDYKGHRLCAQSIIPGILQREQTSTVVYGSMDSGKKITADPAFHELVTQAAKQLGIKEHTVIDAEGNTVKLSAPVEAKGIVGTDGRKYILDLVRVTPRDSYFSGNNHVLTILRPELLSAYIDYHRQKKEVELRAEKAQKYKLSELEAQVQKEKEASQSESQVKEGKQESKEEPPKQTAPQVDPRIEELRKKIDQEISDELKNINMSFNVDVLCGDIYKVAGTPEEIAEDEKQVKQLSQFLIETILPVMVEDYSWYVSIPADGQTLTTAMHAHGMNMRYLGLVAKATENTPILKALTIREMVTRASKHILNAYLRKTEDHELARAITRFFNCLLGDVSAKSVTGSSPVTTVNANANASAQDKGKKTKKKGNKSTDNHVNENHVETESESEVLTLTSAKLWEKITAEVKERYQYDLPERSHSSIVTVVRSLSTLRSLAQKVGIQVNARDYNFTLANPFFVEDVLDVFPIVKHMNHETLDGRNLLEAGKSFLAQGRLDIAYELLTEALAIFHQVYGPMHKDTAQCFANLAMVFFSAKDVDQALDHQEKAVIINERVLGIDHHDTCHSYGNLSLFLNAVGKSKVALTYMKRSLYLTCLMGGISHPDVATTYTNIAMMLQDTQKHKEEIEYLTEACKHYEQLFGPLSLQIAPIYHAIAIAYSQLEQYKDALNFEKKCYAILHTKVGDTDMRAIESNIWLKQFTQKAVQAEVENKKAHRESAHASTAKLNPLKGVAQSQPTVPSTPGNSTIGDRPINEILAYINGKPTGGSRTFSQRNPKPVKIPSVPENGTEESKKPKKKKVVKKKEEENLTQ